MAVFILIHEIFALYMNEQVGVIASDNRQTVVLVALMCLSSVALFVIFPYMALFLKDQFALTNTAAGLAVGSIALISACGAWLGGMIVDHVGWLRMLRLSSVLYVLVFLALAATRRLELVVGLIFLIGFCRLLMEPALKTALVIHDDGSGRLFKLRYMALVGGAIVGPAISTALVPYGAQGGFVLAAAFFVVYLAMTLLLQAGSRTATAGKAAPLSVDWFAVCTLITLGFIFFLGFSQFETTLSLRLAAVFAPDGAVMYRKALLVNAVLAIPVMYLCDRLLANVAMRSQVVIGVVAMTIALWLLFGAPHLAWCVYVGASLFTLGEVILFPLPDIAAAKLATAENRGRLMGLIDIRYLGFFAGPALGGVLLDHSETALAVTLCLLSLAILPVYLLSEKRGQR